MKKQILTVRDVDEEAWRKFRAKTEEKGLKTGDALTQAMRIWIKQKEDDELLDRRPNPKLLLKIKPVTVGRKGTLVRWSEQIDETLYGGK